MTAAGGCSRRGAACAASHRTRSGGSLPGWRARSRRLGAESWFRWRRRLWSCFRRERLSPGRRGRCSASPWGARSSACTGPCHAHRAPWRLPPALQSTGVAAPIDLPTVASPDDLEATAPSGWANMAAPPARRRGVLAHPAPGPHERRNQIAPVLSPIAAAAPGPARQRRRTAPSCERVNPSPLSFGAGAETTMAKPRWPLSISTIAAFAAARWRSSHDCCA